MKPEYKILSNFKKIARKAVTGFSAVLLFMIVLNSFTCLAAEPTNNSEANEQVTTDNTVILVNDNSQKEYNLSLEGAINLSLENNSTFNIKKKDTKIYKIKATKSVLNMLPSFNTSMTMTYQSEISKVGFDDTINIPFIGPVVFSGFDTESKWKRFLDVSATQSITGLYRKYQWKRIADITFKQALLAEEASKTNTVLDTYNYYFDALSARYQLEALLKNESELEASYNLASIKFEEGTTIKRDKQKVEVELDKVKYQVFEKKNEYQEKLDRLKRVIGLEQEDRLNIGSEFSRLDVNCTPEEAIKTALENNPDIENFKLDVKVKKHFKREQYSAYIPEVDVGVSYENQGGTDFSPKNNFLLKFKMNYNFFDWGMRELTVKERQLEVEQSQLAYKDAIDKLKLEVKEKYNRFKESKLLIELSRKAMGLAEKNLEISTLRYKDGYELITEVLNDQSDLAKARSDYYQALFYEQSSIAELKKSMGILLP